MDKLGKSLLVLSILGIGILVFSVMNVMGESSSTGMSLQLPGGGSLSAPTSKDDLSITAGRYLYLGGDPTDKVIIGRAGDFKTRIVSDILQVDGDLQLINGGTITAPKSDDDLSVNAGHYLYLGDGPTDAIIMGRKDIGSVRILSDKLKVDNILEVGNDIRVSDDIYMSNNDFIGIGSSAERIQFNKVSNQIEIKNANLKIDELITGSNSGIYLCVDRYNRICRCGRCA